ncbi:uncharacterized protein LOC122014655 isoform X3 [Zingiber officinale]|uniref:uncharacterized protein LOC122014655 isoform X3 n=1 Tax=Zingiber officinale TaxID=94328 RepID=UPI001C4BC0EE|nr:uncharacterized protein LOC122014655 isoform X3 [Zingiber officinale]
MEAVAGLNRAIPASSSHSSRKEWRAMPDVPYRSNGGESWSMLILPNQPREQYMRNHHLSATRAGKVQVGVGTYDAGFCSITIDNGSRMNDDMLQRKLQEITSLREQLQQMEIELARTIARSEMMELQNSFEIKLKEQIDSNNNLKEQVHEREPHILELERKVEEKDRELQTMKIDSEAAWAKEDLLREQNKELASFRRELDNTESERAQHLNQICDLQEHIQGKDSQILALQDQQL